MVVVVKRYQWGGNHWKTERGWGQSTAKVLSPEGLGRWAIIRNDMLGGKKFFLYVGCGGITIFLGDWTGGSGEFPPWKYSGDLRGDVRDGERHSLSKEKQGKPPQWTPGGGHSGGAQPVQACLMKWQGSWLRGIYLHKLIICIWERSLLVGKRKAK